MTTEATEAVPAGRKGTNPRGITLKAELREDLAIATKAAAAWMRKYDEAVAEIDRSVTIAAVKASTGGLILGVLLGWWAK